MPDMANGYTFYAQVDRAELNKALHQIDSWDGKTRLKVEGAVSTGTKRVAADARRKVPRRTGTLRKSLKSSFKRRGCTGLVKAMAPHAHLIENGVKTSVAEPQKKTVLRFRSGGKLYYRKWTTIPARRPRPFMKPAYDANVGKIIDDIKKAVKS